jgi:hypothetical protein
MHSSKWQQHTTPNCRLPSYNSRAHNNQQLACRLDSFLGLEYAKQSELRERFSVESVRNSGAYSFC